MSSGTSGSGCSGMDDVETRRRDSARDPSQCVTCRIGPIESDDDVREGSHPFTMPEMTRGLLGAKASDDDESGPWPLLVSANEPTYLAGCNRRPKVYVMSNDSVSPDSGAGVADDTRRRNDPVPVAEPVDVVCRDGGLVRLRPLDSSDGEAVVHFYSGLDQQSLYRRFMSHHLPNDAILVHPLASPDPRDQVLGAEISGELIAIGLAVQNGQDQAAEVAFAVATDHQGRGYRHTLARTFGSPCTRLWPHLVQSQHTHRQSRHVGRLRTSRLPYHRAGAPRRSRHRAHT